MIVVVQIVKIDAADQFEPIVDERKQKESQKHGRGHDELTDDAVHLSIAADRNIVTAVEAALVFHALHPGKTGDQDGGLEDDGATVLVHGRTGGNEGIEVEDRTWTTGRTTQESV